MISLKWLTLFSTVAIAAVTPLPPAPNKHVPEGYCCFSLRDSASNALVQQDRKTGQIYLNSDKPEGWYCIDLSDSRNILYDDYWNACILSLNSNQESIGRFTCLDGTPGPNSWTLESGHLAHDGDIGYQACPGSSGSLVWGEKDGDTAGCTNNLLKATDFQGTCDNIASRDILEGMA